MYPDTVAVDIVAVRRIAVRVHITVRSAEIVNAVPVDPAGTHIAVPVKAVPLAVDHLPAVPRIGAVRVAVPPATVVPVPSVDDLGLARSAGRGGRRRGSAAGAAGRLAFKPLGVRIITPGAVFVVVDQTDTELVVAVLLDVTAEITFEQEGLVEVKIEIVE